MDGPVATVTGAGGNVGRGTALALRRSGGGQDARMIPTCCSAYSEKAKHPDCNMSERTKLRGFALLEHEVLMLDEPCKTYLSACKTKTSEGQKGRWFRFL